MNEKLKLFDAAPTIEKKRLPPWLRRSLPKGNALLSTHQTITKNRLHTVCEEARCPNITECFSKKTATFLVMGKECTRACGFCDIDFSKKPASLDPEEPQHIVNSVRELGLSHVVITMVARDDLDDGGANHLTSIIYALQRDLPESTIEVLTSDFQGSKLALDLVAKASPQIFNHNIETVRRLTPKVRFRATYDRSLEVLRYMHDKGLVTKSGIMVGLGETETEVEEALHDLKKAGCNIVTIGQYLKPSKKKLSVTSYVHPDQFALYEKMGYKAGLSYVYSGPFVRSSYNANIVIKEANNRTRIINSDDKI